MDESALSSDSDSDMDLLIRPLIKSEPRPADGANMALELRNAFRRHDKRVLLVDIANKLEWTGGELLERASQVATGLVKQLQVRPNDVIMTICEHTDMEILLALGILFSGAAIYGTQPTDGYAEAKVLCELVRPSVLVVQSSLHERALALRQNVPGMQQTKIVWLDNPIAGLAPIRRNSINVNGRAKLANTGSNSEHLLMLARSRQRLSVLSLSDDNVDNKNNNSDNSIVVETQKQAISDNNNNNNNNDEFFDDLQAKHDRMLDMKLIIDKDQVILFDDLINGPVDEHLIESIARDAIKPSDHVATYMLTSGSTGRPKVVPSTHEELTYGLYSMISACMNPVQERAGARRGSQIYAQKPLNAVESNGAGAGANLSSLLELHQQYNGDHISTVHNNQVGGGIFTHNNNPSNNGSFHIRYKTAMFPFGPNEIVSGDLPLDHGAGLNTMFLSFWLGSKYIVMPSYDVDAFWQAVNDYKTTVSVSSTTFGYRLFNRLKSLIDSNDTSHWQLDSFKFIACAGAKVAFHDLINEVTKVYSHIKLVQCYGCTEIGFISMLHQNEAQTHQHSVGYLFPGLVAKVVDRERTSDKPLGPEERGELLLYAKSKFKGYKCHWQDDPARIFAECHDHCGMFYRTGDQVHYDHEGRLYIHGRFKDTLVLMEDWKILPAELEEVVQEHPLVEMCAIVGVPDPQLPGCHAPKAFVKLIANDSCELKQLAQVDKLLAARCLANDREFICKNIYDFVAERTARPKHLTGGIRILDEFPRIGLLNKIDRKVLRQMD